MTDRLRAIFHRQWPDHARWLACFAVVLFLHVGGALALMMQWDDNELMANPPAITIDLAAVPMAPEIVPTDMPIGPQRIETPPEAETPPPEPEVQLEPPEKPPEKTKKTARLTTAPAPAERRSPIAAAPMPGAGARDSNALPNWRSLLVAQLERNKRYPSDARSRGEQGVAQLAFRVDRSGGVHGARIVRSSGSSSLDQETLALVQRASPLPPPPPEVHGGSIAVVVPIRYNIR